MTRYLIKNSGGRKAHSKSLHLAILFSHEMPYCFQKQNISWEDLLLTMVMAILANTFRLRDSQN